MPKNVLIVALVALVSLWSTAAKAAIPVIVIVFFVVSVAFHEKPHFSPVTKRDTAEYRMHVIEYKNRLWNLYARDPKLLERVRKYLHEAAVLVNEGCRQKGLDCVISPTFLYLSPQHLPQINKLGDYSVYELPADALMAKKPGAAFAQYIAVLLFTEKKHKHHVKDLQRSKGLEYDDALKQAAQWLLNLNDDSGLQLDQTRFNNYKLRMTKKYKAEDASNESEDLMFSLRRHNVPNLTDDGFVDQEIFTHCGHSQISKQAFHLFLDAPQCETIDLSKIYSKKAIAAIRQEFKELESSIKSDTVAHHYWHAQLVVALAAFYPGFKAVPLKKMVMSGLVLGMTATGLTLHIDSEESSLFLPLGTRERRTALVSLLTVLDSAFADNKRGKLDLVLFHRLLKAELNKHGLDAELIKKATAK